MSLYDCDRKHTHRLVLESGDYLFILFSHSVASVTRACGGAVGFCAVNALEIPWKFERELTVSVEHKM